MKATRILHQKMAVRHTSEDRLAIFEVIVWQVPRSPDFIAMIRQEGFAYEE